MSSDKVIQEATNKVFCQRVGFMAIQVADEVSAESPDTPEHEARLAYAQQIFRGDDKALLLTLHVIANSQAIESTLLNKTHTDVQDADLKTAVQAIWTARSLAFGIVNHQLNRIRQITTDVAVLAQQTQNAANMVDSVTKMPAFNKLMENS